MDSFAASPAPRQAHSAAPPRGRGGRRPLAWSLLAGLLLLAGGIAGLAAWPPRGGGTVAAPPPDAAQAAEAAAIRALRARLRTPDAAEFQSLRVYRAGAPDERAVCGRILAADLPGGAAEFVARVVLRGTERPGAQPMVILEQGPGLVRNTAEAQRRHCRDAPPPGSPVAPALSVQAAAPDSATGAAGAPPAAVVAAGGGPAAGLGTAVVRSPVNLRAGPGGGAAVLSTLPRGQVVTVFEHAPGGWLRVGEAVPWGWVHSSLMTDPPP